MKKILFTALMACVALGFTACEDDYADSSEQHIYGETENPPFKGSDANMPSASMNLAQANGGTETKTVSLTDYESAISEQLGMTLDQAIAGLNDGSVRFLLGNPARRVWDKTPANAGGDYKWTVSSSGIITDSEKGTPAMTVEFAPSSKEMHFTLISSSVSPGIIPVVAGFVKTDDSAYSTNFRFQTLVTVTDASIVEAELSIPAGDYTNTPLALAPFAANIEYALGVTNLYDLAKGLDTADPVYDVYLMDGSGNIYGGPGTYTANGAGYWMKESCEICNWGADGFAFFIEPDIYDWDAEDYRTDGGAFAVGRLSAETPASGTTIKANIVIRHSKDAAKSLTIMLSIYFE